MDKKGTGWIPDYPDVRDYKLESEEIRKLVNKLQGKEESSSIEIIVEKVSAALRMLAERTEDESFNSIQKELEKEILGDLSFSTAKVHKVLEVGISDREVLQIKDYLKQIFDTYRLYYSMHFRRHHSNYYYKLSITDSRFDQETEAKIRDFQYNQKVLAPNGQAADGIVDIDTMKALKEVASIIDYESFHCIKLTDRWMKDIQEKKENLSLSSEQWAQVIIASELRPISEKLKEIVSCQESMYFARNNESVKEILDLTKKEKELLEAENKSTKVERSLIDIQLQISAKLIQEVAQLIKKIQLSSNQDEELNILEELEQISQECNPLLGNEEIRDELLDEKKQILSENKDKLILFAHFALNFGRESVRQKLAKNSLLEVITSIRGRNSWLTKEASREKFESFRNFIENTAGICIGERFYFKDLLDLVKDLLDLMEGNKASELIDLLEFVLNSSGTRYGISAVLQSIQAIEKQNFEMFPLQVHPELFERQVMAVPAPIPLQVLKLINKKLLVPVIKKTNQEAYSEFRDETCGYLQDNHLEAMKPEELKRLSQLLYPIIDATQIYPLGQFNNLDELVDKGIRRFEALAHFKGSQEVRSDTIDQHEELKFRVRVFEAILTIKDALEQQENQEERCAVDKIFLKKIQQFDLQIESYLQERDALLEELKDEISLQSTKRPIFEMTEKSPGQMEDFTAQEEYHEHLQFPVSRDLLAKHKEIIAERQPQAPSLEPFYQNEQNDRNLYLVLPEFVDLSFWCSPIEDQGKLNSCTAHAGTALTEYFEKRRCGKYTDVSSLFLYKVARNLMQRQGNSGASVRDTMRAMTLFGVCPDEYWPYDEAKFDEEPTPFCYSFAQNYQALKYFRLDSAGISLFTLLSQIKVVLTAGFPCMFGFTLYSSVYDDANYKKGHIPYPTNLDKVEGGHAVVAVGYHDRKVIENADGEECRGALLIRNSWGTKWGQGGYGWLPYKYILNGLTADWWSLIKSEWLETGSFGIGSGNWTSDVRGKDRQCGEHECWCGQHLNIKKPSING